MKRIRSNNAQKISELAAQMPVYVTQDEYDALPETKNTDGKLYVIIAG